jgi:hypothetical protein
MRLDGEDRSRKCGLASLEISQTIVAPKMAASLASFPMRKECQLKVWSPFWPASAAQSSISRASINVRSIRGGESK